MSESSEHSGERSEDESEDEAKAKDKAKIKDDSEAKDEVGDIAVDQCGLGMSRTSLKDMLEDNTRVDKIKHNFVVDSVLFDALHNKVLGGGVWTPNHEGLQAELGHQEHGQQLPHVNPIQHPAGGAHRGQVHPEGAPDLPRHEARLDVLARHVGQGQQQQDPEEVHAGGG